MAERITVNSKKPVSIKENLISHKRKTDFQSDSSPVNRILYLQRTVGNQAVSRLMRSGALQAKLRIGQPGDVYEQEADRVADAVMRMPEPGVQRQVEPEEEEEETLQSKPLANQITPLVQVQRQEEPEEEKEETLQAKPLAEEITPLVQRQVESEEEEEELIQPKRSGAEAAHLGPSLEARINSLSGGGRPLSPSIQNFFEPRFGHDFSQVRVHTGSQATHVANSVNAQAFTKGHDIVFGSGRYSPDTATGKNLIAHELAHVIQQSQDAGTETTNSPIRMRAPERIQRTLERAMVQYANEELWSLHPELGRRQLTSGRADAELRREWLRYYRWGKAHLSRGNCFRYALNDPSTAGQVHSPFPGGTDPGGHITCSIIMDGARSSGATNATLDRPCNRGSRKIGGVIQDASAPAWNDYHWYRQEANGRWTHKRGTGPVEHVDASGNPITDPATADRNYSGTPDYDRFCGYLCVLNNIDIDRVP